MTSWVDTSEEVVREPIKAGFVVVVGVVTVVAVLLLLVLLLLLVVPPKSRASEGDISEGSAPPE